MADKKISELTATTTIGDADLLTTVQSGLNKKITGANVKSQIGFERYGTDVQPKNAGDNINLLTGGLKDTNVTTAINLGDVSNTSFDTTNKTIVGALNEVNSKVIAESLWDRVGSDVTPQNVGDNVNIGTGGLKDNDVTTAISLGDSLNTVFATTNKTIVGSVNEVYSSIPTANEEILTISSDGQTAFTLSNIPSGQDAFTLFLNGQLRTRTTDYTLSGTSLTWNDPGSLTLKTTDELKARYNDTSLSGSGVKEIFLAATDYNDNTGSYRERVIAGTGAHRFTFKAPNDLTALVSAKLIGIISAGADGSGRDIDITSEYASAGEPYNQHSEADTTSTYDFTGKTNQITEVIDLSVILTNISANDFCGIFVDHNGIGGSIFYLGIVLRYTT